MKRMLVVLLFMVAIVAIGAGQAYASEGCDSLGDQILKEAKVQPWIAEAVKAKCKTMAEQASAQCKARCYSTYGSDVLTKYGCTYGCRIFKEEMWYN